MFNDEDFAVDDGWLDTIEEPPKPKLILVLDLDSETTTPAITRRIALNGYSTTIVIYFDSFSYDFLETLNLKSNYKLRYMPAGYKINIEQI